MRARDKRSVSIESLAVVDVEQPSDCPQQCVLFRASVMGWQPDGSTERAPTPVAAINVFQFEARLFEVLR
jgi:hypothetical protein